MHRGWLLTGRLSVAVASLIVALGLSGCNGADETDPETTDDPTDAAEPAAERPTLGLPGRDFGFPSPFTYRRGPGYVMSSFIYDTLVWKDASGELLPWLAEEWEQSDGGRVYTFELREDVSWHDGEPFTAEDVAFTFDYFQEHTISPEVIIQPLPQIEEVEAIDDHTVEFQLSSPLAPFFDFGGVGSVPIVPQHIWADVDDPTQASDLDLLVGTGPYELEEYARGEGAYRYTANDDFFLGVPFVEGLEYRPVDDPLAALQAKEVDVAFPSGVVPDVLEPFRDNSEFEVIEQPSGNSGTGLFWNLDEGGALADVQFRRACAMAIDRDDLVERLHGGLAEPGNPGWIPRDHPAHAEVEQYDYDPEAANELLDEAGYEMNDQGVRVGPDGEPLRFELLLESPPPPVTDLVVAALEDIGVELEPQALDTPALNERVIGGEAEMSLIGFGGMNTDHGAGGYLRQVYHSETQATQHAQGYHNAEVDRLIEEQQTTIAEPERREIVAEIQQLIAEDLPMLPLVYPQGFAVYDEEIFDAWYYTEGGIGGTVPLAWNKHMFVTGQETGLEMRPHGHSE